MGIDESFGSDLASSLAPLPFQTALVEYLEREESGLWAMFSSSESLDALAESTRLELLKQTVRLSAESHPRAYEAARHAAEVVGVEAEVVVYQAPQGGGTNACLFFVPETAHVVLTGPILEDLDDAELRAIFGHELAHHRLWTMNDGRYWVADRLLDANGNHPRAEPAHIITAERFQLYTELFADRGGALAGGSTEAAIRLLLKVKTGLSDPDVSAYRKQVDDVFEGGVRASDGGTHPEAFIRARALDAWTQGDETQIDAMIRGPLRVASLDCLGQRDVEALTQRFFRFALSHPWLRTEAVLGQVRLMWTSFKEDDLEKPDPEFVEDIVAAGEGLFDYWCYLLLDLAVADRQLDDMGLLAGQLSAESLDIRERFETMANKELRVTKKRLAELWKERERLVAKLPKASAPEVV